jgi:DNA-binding IclR family transcriptional regulator
MKEVLKTRQAGYALDDEEYIQGVRAVAAPILVPGRHMAAIWVVGFTQSMSNEKISIIASETKYAAEMICGKLGLGPVEVKSQ